MEDFSAKKNFRIILTAAWIADERREFPLALLQLQHPQNRQFVTHFLAVPVGNGGIRSDLDARLRVRAEQGKNVSAATRFRAGRDHRTGRVGEFDGAVGCHTLMPYVPRVAFGKPS